MSETQNKNTETLVNQEQKETLQNSEDFTKQMEKSKDYDKNNKLSELWSVIEDNHEEPKLSEEDLKEKML
jgi:hypothetical protein